jgi:hypothetical protein
MPKKLNWNFVSKLKFQNVNEFKDWYMDLNAIVKHNNLVTCNCCIRNNKQAKQLKESKFVKLDEHLYEYNHVNGQISTLNLSNQTCTCSDTIDKGICLHLIRVALTEKFPLPGMLSLDKFTKRQRRQKKLVLRKRV